MPVNNSVIAQQTWEKLRVEGLVSGPVPSAETPDSPWYLRMISGIAGWLASLFLFGFFALLFSDLVTETGSLLVNAVGFLLIGLAYGLYKHLRNNEFLSQFALACSLSGQLILFINWVSDAGQQTIPFLAMSLLQMTLAITVPNFLHRVICTWFAGVALYWTLSIPGYGQLASIVLLASFAAIWLREPAWGRHRRLFEGLGTGLALALVHLNGHLLYVDEFTRQIGPQESQLSTAVNSAGLLLVWALLLNHLIDSVGVRINTRVVSLTALATLVFIALGWLVPAGATAALILVTGFSTQRKFLLLSGIVALLGFVAWYYYQLEQTLFFKSLVLTGIGVLFLAVLAIWKLLLNPATETDSERENTGAVRPGVRRFIILATCLVILIAGNFSIVDKERLINNGQTVYLELAPIDPRSIAQGDYMQLFFQVARDIQTTQSDLEPGNGKVIVELDETGVGRFRGLFQGQALQDNQLALQYRVRDHLVKFATNAYFFQEGTAANYERARYGEFKVAGNGSLLLVALRDAELNLL